MDARLALCEVYTDSIPEWDLTTGAELRSWSGKAPMLPAASVHSPFLNVLSANIEGRILDGRIEFAGTLCYH